MVVMWGRSEFFFQGAHTECDGGDLGVSSKYRVNDECIK